MRKGFKTTIDEELLYRLKTSALTHNVNVNDILEKLIVEYLEGRTKIEFNSK